MKGICTMDIMQMSDSVSGLIVYKAAKWQICQLQRNLTSVTAAKGDSVSVFK